MPRLLLLTFLLAIAVAPPAAAQGVPFGGFTSDNVEFVKNFARHADTAGGRLHDGYFYITTERDLAIYDVKDPENPQLTGTFRLPEIGTPVFTEEDPDTNGKVLLVSNGGTLMVIDVSDKTAPKLLSTLDGVDEHTMSCVLDCTWAYGSEGAIVDLRDPAKPVDTGKTWDKGAENFHDVTEVRPGIVLTSTEPMYLLDARTDPANPTVLAETRPPGFTHANLWPHQGSDDFALVGGEATGPACGDSESATFQTWDTRGWQGTKTFKLVDQFAMSTGLPPQGASPESTYCVHWFDTHPTYRNGGLVAIAWYEHGVRFLQIGTDGKIGEIGWYVPGGGQSSGAYWISDKVLYVADYLRGMDILRFTGDVPQGRPGATEPGRPAAPSPANPPSKPRGGGKSFDELVRLPSAKPCARARSFRIRVKSKDVKRVTVRVDGRKARTSGRKSIKVKRLPRRKRFSVQVLVRTRSGHETLGQRSYKGC